MSSQIQAYFFQFLLISSILAVASGFYVQSDYPEFASFRPIKKSGQLRALAGSRNCFFSPINCVITHDVNTYRNAYRNTNRFN